MIEEEVKIKVEKVVKVEEVGKVVEEVVEKGPEVRDRGVKVLVLMENVI